MGQVKQINDILFNAGNQSVPVTIEIPQPITIIHLIIRATIVTDILAGTIVTVSDGVKRLLRQLTLLRGGEPIQTWGRNNPEGSAGVLLESVMRSWLMAVPARVDPDGLMAAAGTAVGNGTHVVEFRLAVPISLPPNLYPMRRVDQSALRIAQETWEIQATWGTAADIVALTGNASAVITVAPTVLAVAVEIDRTLNPVWPQGNSSENSGLLLKTVPLSDDLSTAANAAEEFDISKVGDVLAHGLLAYDNSVLDDDVINRLTYLVNDDLEVFRADWEMAQGVAEYQGDNSSDTGLPAGMSFINFDAAFDLKGRIQTARAAGWKVRADHGGGTAVSRLIQQVLYLQRFVRRGPAR